MLNPQSLLRLGSVGLLWLGTSPSIAQTHPDTIYVHPDRSFTQVSFKPPPGEGEPDRTVGAGSRRDEVCPQQRSLAPSADRSTLMALVPPNNYGLTVAGRPTFFIALPKTSARQIVLSIWENGTRHHSQTFIPIEDRSGIIKIQPSPDSPPLEIGKRYQWAVVVVCGERPNPNDPAIVSWVRRIDPPQPLPRQIQQENALAQAIWYGEQGLWYDTLTALIQAKRSQPDSQVMSDIWANFLSSVGLGDVSTEPLLF